VVAKLVRKSDGAVFELGPNPTMIGRSRACTISVPDDPMLSRTHCLVHKKHGRWLVTDLGSSNGVFLNGRRVTEAELKNGDVIQAGKNLFTFLEAEQ